MPAKDPERRRATVRAWYARTKERSAERRRGQRKQRRLALVAWYAELKSQLVCPCGQDHPACIQFHHADARTKECTVADAIRRGFGRARVLREISKCTVLCANCHFKLHERERRDGDSRS